MSTATKTKMRLPGKRALEERMGDKPENWAGQCHGAAMAVVAVMGEEHATLRRGYFIGDRDPAAYFYGRPCQHSWVELRDGRVCDPTRFAFTAEPAWPLWIGDDADYDIGGCKTVEPYGQAPDSDFTQGFPLVELAITSRAIESTGLDFCMDSELLMAGTAKLTVPQVFWLANLPLKERPMLGALSIEWAPEVYRALVNAGHESAIPIDRRDWMLPELSEGRSSF